MTEKSVYRVIRKWQILEEVKQDVCDLWIEKSISSIYYRNGRPSIKISKFNYLENYGKIIKKPPLKEKTKWQMLIFVATKGVVTCTLRCMRTVIEKKFGYMSLSNLNFLKSFFVTNATEK